MPAPDVLFSRDLIDSHDGERLTIVGATLAPTRAWAPSALYARRADGACVIIFAHDVKPAGQRFYLAKPEAA